MKQFWVWSRKLAIALAGSGLLAGATMPARAAELWFGPGDDLDVQGVVQHPDFQELFSAAGSWQTGLSRVNVLQLRAPWFARMPDGAVRTVVAFLAEHRIKLALPMGGVQSETCGKGVEGIMVSKGIIGYPQTLKKRGVAVDYMVLDEPLFFGHDYAGHDACNFPVAEVAKRVAWSVRAVRNFYPAIKVDLVEPIQSLEGGPEELAAFLENYRRELGEYPHAVRFDLAWHREWEGVVPPFIAMLDSKRIGYSIIYDAEKGGAAPTDAAWVRSAEANVMRFRQAVRQPPAEVVLQTWTPRPVRIVPENDPTTMTGFLKWYVEHFR
jgi:hypothetical protein